MINLPRVSTKIRLLFDINYSWSDEFAPVPPIVIGAIGKPGDAMPNPLADFSPPNALSVCNQKKI